MAASYWRNSFAGEDNSAAAIHHEMEEMVRGIQAYLQHSFERPQASTKTITKFGQSELVCAGEFSGGDDAEILLLIPSLINKAYILDLMEARSMLRWMGGKNVQAYLLDWGDLVRDEEAQGPDDIVAKKITAAAEYLNNEHGRPIHALGYCMGGTFLAGAGCLRPELFASLIYLAAPWDFDSGTQALKNRVQFWAPSILPSMEEKGHMSVDWLQMLFASLDPTTAMRKFKSFAQMDQGSDAAELFVAVEDWLNDGVPLPLGVAQACIKDWFFENKPGRGEWELCGKVIEPSACKVPSFVIASSRDRLVEYETAAALAQQLSDAKLHDPACGHIGMIAGGQAIENVWEPVQHWIKDHTL